ncbi:MAG: hypothetical protein QOJ59_4725 [Thermomicrobiales bacterium]|jgi:hypothetical protein|nr:hypothetical protein [Thermomicrobiales bacterium]
MHFKRTALTLLTALAIMGGAAAPSASAVGDNEAEIDLSVTLTEAGIFSMSLANDANGAIVQPTNATSATATVNNIKMRIMTMDTKSYRPAFDIWMSATPYTSNLQVPSAPPNTYYQFPEDALWIYSTRDPSVGRCDYDVTFAPNECSLTRNHDVVTSFPIGNAWALDSNGVKKTPARPTGGNEAARWTSNVNPSGNAFNTLDVPRRVVHFDAGAGTLDTRPSVFLGVTIPGGMPAAVYTSTITVTIVPPGP